MTVYFFELVQRTLAPALYSLEEQITHAYRDSL